jgi:thymidylate kinase
MEEADRGFFERVEEGYRKLAATEPGRVQTIDATLPVDRVSQAVWMAVEPLLSRIRGSTGC